MAELAAELSARLSSSGLDPASVVRVIQAGLAEDLADGPDVTTAATIPPAEIGTADVVARRSGVIAGLSVADAVFQLVGAGDGFADRVQRAATPIAPSGLPSELSRGFAVSCRHFIADGDEVSAGDVLMTVTGPLDVILTAERTALNLLCHMSALRR